MPSGRQRRAWAAGIAGMLGLVVIQASAQNQSAERSWVRVVRGDVEVVGNADAARLRAVADQVGDVREALGALVPATSAVAVPLTYLVDCQWPGKSDIYERPWRIYVVSSCKPFKTDDVEVAEWYGQVVLRRAVRGLPLWLEIGIARLAMAAERLPDGTFQVAKFDVSDVRGYLYPRVPPREVFSARPSSETWQNRVRRAALVRQSLVYVHRIIDTGDIGGCTGHTDDSDDPTERLRLCLQGDIDRFHESAMAQWPEGLTRLVVRGGITPAASEVRVLSEIEWKARAVDASLVAGAVSHARRRLTEWGLTARSGPAFPGLLARLAAASGETARARQLFEDAVAANADPLDAYHYAAMLLEPALRAGSVERLDARDAMRAERLLDDVVGARQFADAYALRGIAKLAAGDHGGAMESLSTAVDMWPNERYALWLTRAFVAGRQTASARRLADSLRASTEDADTRSTAERLLRDLPAGQGDATDIPVLPPLGTGEQRTRGRLLSIDCGDDWVSLMVQTQHGTERFVTARLSLLRFVAFSPNPAPAICGPRRDTEPVVVNWRPFPNQPSDATGVASAVAFVSR